MDLPRVSISSPDELFAARVTAVHVGTAPDGLPLVLVVDRGETPQELMGAVAARLGYSAPDEYEGQPLGAVVERVAELLRARDLQPIETPDGRRECFISRQPVGQICGATLLSRLLAPAPADQPAQPSTLAPDTRVSALAEPASEGQGGEDPGGGGVRVREELGELRLVLPLRAADQAGEAGHRSRALVARRVHRPGRSYQFMAARELLPETLGALPGGRWVGDSPHGLFAPVEGATPDLAAYRSAREEAVLARRYARWSLGVPRQEVCDKVIAVARELARLHAEGLVHGDVKPGNVLLTGTGAGATRCIDSLALRPGEPSPAMTPGWAAPEQVLNQPVSPATDQYPLGVMLCRLLDGVIYGEEVTVVVPTGGRSTERFTMMKNPGVYLDPQLAPVAREGAAAWQALLSRCLAFAPEERFASMAGLVEELLAVSTRHPLVGELTTPLSFGVLARTDAAAARPALAWLVHEQAPGAMYLD